jgi:ParB-like chromosome segregation protein Spo0J
MDSHRREWREDIKDLETATRDSVGAILSTVSELSAKAGGLMGTVEASQRRDDRFHDHDWPMLVRSMTNLGQRMHRVEVNQEHIRDRVGMGPTPTPADGIRARMGVPIPTSADGDED